MNPKKDESFRLNNKEAMLGRYLSQQMRQAGLSEKPVGPCPPLENIAAFMDGMLSEVEREELIVHLNRCEPCYEVFIETVKAMEDKREDSPEKEPGGDRIRSNKFYYIIPSVFAAAAAIALFFIFPTFSPHLPRENKTIAKMEKSSKQEISGSSETQKMEDKRRKAPEKGKETPLSVREMMARLSQPDLKSYIKDTKDHPQMSYGFAGALPLEKVSFRMGVSITTLNAALLSGDGELAKEIIDRIISQLTGMEGSDKVVAWYQKLIEEINRGILTQSLSGSSALLEKVFENEQTLVFLKLGEWVEWGKLAAHAGKSNLIWPETIRYFIDHLDGDDGPPGVTDALKKIEKAVQEGKGGRAESTPLKKAFSNIEKKF